MLNKIICTAIAVTLLLAGCADYEYLDNPPQPATVSIGIVTDSTVALHWTHSTDDYFGRYTVYYGTDNRIDSASKAADTLTGVYDTSTIVAGLDSTTHYYFRVVTTNAYGMSASSNIVDTFTLKSPRSALRLFHADSITDSSAVIRWERSWHSNFSAYLIYLDTTRSVDTNAAPLRTISLVHIGDTSYTLTGLLPSTRYWVAVHIKADGHFITSSIPDSLTTRDGHPAKSTLVIIDSSVTDTSVTVLWTRNHDADFARYVLVFDTIAKIDSIAKPDTRQNGISQVSSVNDTSLTIRTLGRAKRYFFCLYTQDRTGLASASNVDSVTTQSGIPARVTLNVIDSTASDTSVVVRWGASTEADFSRYIVSYDTVRFADSAGSKQAPPIVTVTDTTLLLTSLLPNRWYWFNVRAEDRGRLSSFSALDSVRTIKPLPRAVDSLQVANVDSTSITLSWKPYAGKYFNRFLMVRDTTWYSLEKRTSFDAAYQPAIPAIEETHFTIGGLKPSTHYYLTVYVENIFGVVAAAPRVEATTKAIQ
jgi:hypothetical protein